MSSIDPVDLDELRKPLALTLPIDLWVRTLRLLDYPELKKASRICKTLQEIINRDEFDLALFRAGPAKSQLLEGATLEIHPMLEKTDCVFKEFETARIFHQGVGQSDYKAYYPKDYPTILNEYATAPASSLIIVQFDAGTTKPLSKMKGAKVGDVLKWIGKFWKPIDFDRRLGDHRFFEGWEEARAEGQNKTRLISAGFGS